MGIMVEQLVNSLDRSDGVVSEVDEKKADNGEVAVVIGASDSQQHHKYQQSIIELAGITNYSSYSTYPNLK